MKQKTLTFSPILNLKAKSYLLVLYNYSNEMPSSLLAKLTPQKRTVSCVSVHLLPLGHLVYYILRGVTWSSALQHATWVSFSLVVWLQR